MQMQVNCSSDFFICNKQSRLYRAYINCYTVNMLTYRCHLVAGGSAPCSCWRESSDGSGEAIAAL